MVKTHLPPASLVDHFAVTAPALIAETVLARIWKVHKTDGSTAALKVYHVDMADEAPGLSLLHAWQGTGAARLFDRTETAVLLEWCDGASLGDLVRSGQDQQASQHLLSVYRALHANPTLPSGLTPLAQHLQDLFALRPGPELPSAAQDTLDRTTALAKNLLDHQRPAVPLHGDLHHDNIIGSSRGYLAIDPKGLIGDPLYDLANAFRNPVGAEPVYSDPKIIAARAQLWATELEVSAENLLDWAAIHSLASLAWKNKGPLTKNALQDLRLTQTFITVRDTLTG